MIIISIKVNKYMEKQNQQMPELINITLIIIEYSDKIDNKKISIDRTNQLIVNNSKQPHVNQYK